MDSAVARFRDLDDDELAAYPDAAWSVGGTLNQVERYAEAAPILQRGLEALRRTRQGHLLMHLNVLASRTALALLELDQALALIEAAEETARLEGLRDQLAFALWQRGQVWRARRARRRRPRRRRERPPLRRRRARPRRPHGPTVQRPAADRRGPRAPALGGGRDR